MTIFINIITAVADTTLSIAPVQDRFDFPRQNIRKFGEKLLIKTSRKECLNILEQSPNNRARQQTSETNRI